MPLVTKTTTPAAQAANRANSAESTGPATAGGKDKSKMNAFKHGQFAARPDPAALMLAQRSEEEETERQDLRERITRCYDPQDDFAALQAEELADLKFEQQRLDRVQQILWQREQELLGFELRRRALLRRPHVIEGLHCDTTHTGLAGAPDSPAKYREMLVHYDAVLAYAARGDFAGAKTALRSLFGREPAEHRGRKMWNIIEYCQFHEKNDAGQAVAQLRVLIEDEKADAREMLEIVEQEVAELSPAGQVAHLLAATHSRAWAWVRQQENFLRRSIDRKVRCLIELRRQAAQANAARANAARGNAAGANATGRDGPRNSSPGPPPSASPGASAGARPGATPGATGSGEPPVGNRDSGAGTRDSAPQTGTSEIPNTETRKPDTGFRAVKKIAPNRGTKPLCALKSAKRFSRRCARALVQGAKSGANWPFRPARRASTGLGTPLAGPFWPRRAAWAT